MARDLRLFYIFRLLSTSYLFVPISVFFALSRGLSLIEVGLLNSIYSLVVILTEVPTGALADRLGRRPAMIAGSVVMVAASLTFYVAHSFAVFAVAQGLAALSMTLCSGTDSAYLFDLLDDNGRAGDYPRMEGTASAYHQAGQCAAYAAGGLLATVDLGLPYLASAGVAVLAFVVALRLREDHGPAMAGVGSRELVDHMVRSFRLVGHRRALGWAIGYSAVVFVLLRGTDYVYQPYLRAFHFGYAEIGLIFAAVYLLATMVAHRADALRRRLAEGSLLWILLGTLVVTFLLMGASSGVWSLGVLAIQAAANGLYSPLVKPLVNREIPGSDLRATVFSVESMIRRAAYVVFSPLVGWLMTHASPAAGLTLCGALGAVGLVVLGLSRPRPAATPEAAPRAVTRPTPSARLRRAAP